MRTSSKKGSGIGCLIVLAVLLAVGLIQSGVRYVSDKPRFDTAHAAYTAGNCEMAVQYYEEYTNKFRLFDFGKLKEKGLAESSECDQFLAAVDQGILGLYEFSIDHSGSGLAARAKDRGVEMINHLTDSSDLSPILGYETCTKQNELLTAGWLPETNTMPKFLYYCSLVMIDAGDSDSAMQYMMALMQDHGQSEMAGKVWDSLNNGTEFCPLLSETTNNQVFSISQDAVAQYYLSCGRNYEAEYNYNAAVNIYESFLEVFPDHASSVDVQKSLAAALIEQARATGSGTIERPDLRGYAPTGVARVVIQNDSPHDLKLVFSGPDARIEILAACPDCIDYSITGPMYCPEKGPIGTYELTPGTYEVLVETTNEEDIIPFTGTWGLDGGKEFYSCFFVVTSYY